MVTTLGRLLAKAERGGYAIPALNVTNLETTQAVARAAALARSPVIMQNSERAIAYAGHATILSIMQSVANTDGRRVPIVTHLDHGKHFPIVKRSIQLGYTSVHMDASEQSYKRNIQLTARAVRLGHRRGTTVQGELGYLLGNEGMTGASYSRREMEKIMTDPAQADDFVKKTGVDTLAIACGTAHGFFRGRERIDFKRLAAIRARVAVPLVLHGGSGVPDSELKRAVKQGVRIINIDTTLRIRFLTALARAMRSYNLSGAIDVRVPLETARLTMQREAIRLMKLLGSYGHG